MKRKEEEEKCLLLIIPFSNEKELTKFEINCPIVKHYARNLLEVDDEFYGDLLGRYKKWKVVEKL